MDRVALIVCRIRINSKRANGGDVLDNGIADSLSRDGTGEGDRAAIAGSERANSAGDNLSAGGASTVRLSRVVGEAGGENVTDRDVCCGTAAIIRYHE